MAPPALACPPTSPAVTELLAGRLDLIVALMPGVARHVAGGRLRALAVTGGERSRFMPTVPTSLRASTLELGLVCMDRAGCRACRASAERRAQSVCHQPIRARAARSDRLRANACLSGDADGPTGQGCRQLGSDHPNGPHRCRIGAEIGPCSSSSSAILARSLQAAWRRFDRHIGAGFNP